MKNLFLTCLVPLLGFGCNSDSGGGGEASLAELTTEQRITVNTLTSEFGALEAVNRGAGTNPSNLQQKLRTNMDKAYNDQLCDRQTLDDNDNGTEQSRGTTIRGSQCPIFYDYGLDTVIKVKAGEGATSYTVTAKMELFYKSKKETDMYRDTDVTSYEINMTGSGTSGVGEDQQSSSAKSSSTYAGSLESKIFGSIPISATTSEDVVERKAEEGESVKTGLETMKVSIIFPDFKAVGVVVTDFSNEKAKTYSINGKAGASRRQFEYLFGNVLELLEP